MKLAIPSALIDAMIAHARAEYPNEACGLLVGQPASANRFLPMANSLSSPTAYEMDPAALASIFRSLRDSGEELVGIFHSHPRGAAEPSQRDLEHAYYPEAVHVIVSLADREHPQIRAFRLIDGQSYEIELRAIV